MGMQARGAGGGRDGKVSILETFLRGGAGSAGRAAREMGQRVLRVARARGRDQADQLRYTPTIFQPLDVRWKI